MNTKEALKVSKNILEMGDNSVYSNSQYAQKLAKVVIKLVEKNTTTKRKAKVLLDKQEQTNYDDIIMLGESAAD